MASTTTVARPVRAPVRRVVTGHTPEGKSIVIEDAPVEPHPLHGAPTLASDLYWTDKTPPSNDVVFKDLARDHANELFAPGGTTFRVVEIPPGQRSPFHRTVSLDYGVLTHGELTMILDDGKRVVLKAGDVLIQRGTIHAFLNEGTEWTRLYCVMLPSQKVKIGDKELDTEFQIPGRK